ncbi:MAG TPA: hypothetical protein VGK47_08880 [Nitrososphaeraceae archaeon]
MSERIRCGAHYCKICKRCLRLPRKRKNFQPDWHTICAQCGPTILHMTYVPEHEGLETDFFIDFKHIPKLIEELSNAYNQRHYLTEMNRQNILLGE